MSEHLEVTVTHPDGFRLPLSESFTRYRLLHSRTSISTGAWISSLDSPSLSKLQLASEAVVFNSQFSDQDTADVLKTTMLAYEHETGITPTEPGHILELVSMLGIGAALEVLERAGWLEISHHMSLRPGSTVSIKLTDLGLEAAKREDHDNHLSAALKHLSRLH